MRRDIYLVKLFSLIRIPLTDKAKKIGISVGILELTGLS